jgi:hypothetical protein
VVAEGDAHAQQLEYLSSNHIGQNLTFSYFSSEFECAFFTTNWWIQLNYNAKWWLGCVQIKYGKYNF